MECFDLTLTVHFAYIYRIVKVDLLAKRVLVKFAIPRVGSEE